MKLKRILAAGLTVAAIASCVVVPTALAGITVHNGGVYTVKREGDVFEKMQGYVTATVTGYSKVDCYLVQDLPPVYTVARKTYKAYYGRRAYYTGYALKSPYIKAAGITGYSS